MIVRAKSCTSLTLPVLAIAVEGTAPVARIDIVRQVDTAVPQYVYSAQPGRSSARLRWTDTNAKPGAVNMYYIRIMQEDGKMAWASPLWIRYEP